MQICHTKRVLSISFIMLWVDDAVLSCIFGEPVFVTEHPLRAFCSVTQRHVLMPETRDAVELLCVAFFFFGNCLD